MLLKIGQFLTGIGTSHERASALTDMQYPAPGETSLAMGLVSPTVKSQAPPAWTRYNLGARNPKHRAW